MPSCKAAVLLVAVLVSGVASAFPSNTRYG